MSIEQTYNSLTSNNNEESIRKRFHLNETPVQWITDPVSGREKFRITIHIDGFHPNEVHFRVEGNQLLIHGEHVELANLSSAKKIIEKSYELPRGLDLKNPNVTFPTGTTMQVEFFSPHSNVIYQDDQNSLKLSSNYETSRPPPQITQSRSSTEYTTTRKIGTTLPNTSGSTFSRNSNSNFYTPYSQIRNDYSSTNYGSSFSSSNNQYQPQSNSQYVPRYTSLSSAPISTSHNVEVREFSRRIPSTNSTVDSSIFPQNFNTDGFYRSAFQPKVVTDAQGQQLIEMNLDIGNYSPSEIKISVNGNDLIVQAEHNENQPPTSSSRALFFKQTTLPSNTDLASLSSQYHPEGRLQITAKLSDGQNFIQ